MVNAEVNVAAQNQSRQVSIDSDNESEEIPHSKCKKESVERTYTLVFNRCNFHRILV